MRARAIVTVAAAVAVGGCLLAAAPSLALIGWGTPAGAAGGPLSSVSCVSPSFCIAVGTYTAKFNGSRWGASTNADDSDGQLGSVSCRSADSCVAVDTVGNGLTYNGRGWTKPKDVDGTTGINSVSCPRSGSMCVAVDGNGAALTESGGAWSRPKRIDAKGGLNAVSCPTSSFCMAVDQYGNAVTYDGNRWSAPKPTGDNEGDPTSVSCASASFCVMVDTTGYAVTYRRSGWSKPELIDDNSPTGIESVSCTSPSFCAEVDEDGQGPIFDGEGWDNAGTIDPGIPLDSVSCSSSRFCMAVDDDGNAIPYGEPRKSSPPPKSKHKHKPKHHKQPTPKKPTWPLPNPCDLPAQQLDNFGDYTSSEGKLKKADPGTSQATATCTFYNPDDEPNTIYVGYVAPSEPGGKVSSISGWPGAELIDSTAPNLNNDYYWVVWFKRTFQNHEVWGQVWFRGSSCTPGEPSGADIAKALYEAIGPGPAVSVPPPQHISNPCTG
jgi:hypothetical protein